MSDYSKAPFPYFGGKRYAAPHVWAALGDPDHYVEPFGGSLAVLLQRPHKANRKHFSETVNDADGLLCLAPQTKVLGYDLRWRPLDDLTVGDMLLAFDEFNGPTLRTGLAAPSNYRKMRRATVTATARTVKPCYRLTFDDGTTVVASADHQWLSGSHANGSQGGRAWRWMSTKSLVCNRETQRSWVMKVCDVVESERTWEAGWLAGFLDGEGNIRTKSTGWQLSASQKAGPESDMFADLMTARGIPLSTYPRVLRSPRHQPQESHVVNGKRNVLRTLMLIRPERLIANLMETLDGRLSLYGREHEAVGLISKEFLGDVEVIALETDTATYIAEGLASHNCNFWRAIQSQPDVVAEAASWPVSEIDQMARQLAILKWHDEAMRERLRVDPVFCDPLIAGWWVWGICNWIGSGWCDGTGPWVVDHATGRVTKRVKGEREPGVVSQLPAISDGGQGVNHPGLREPGVGVEPDFHPMTMPELRAWFRFLSARLRHVRILCGDWTRLTTNSATKILSVRGGNGHCGIFLDPPYDLAERARVYTHESNVATDVRAWCLANGDDPEYRIVLAGFDTEHVELEDHGWRVVEWFKAGYLRGGMGNIGGSGNSQMHRDRLWLSPHCLEARKPIQDSLFEELG